MDIKAIQALIESDMNDVNQLIHAQMRSDSGVSQSTWFVHR